MRDEWLQVQSASSTLVQEGFHVPLLGPAHVADGIVDAGFLIERIVATRAVRARQEERQLLVVVGTARDLHTDRTHHNHAASIPAKLTCQLHWIVRSGSRRNQYAVDPSTTRKCRCLREHVIGAQHGCVCTQFARQLDLRWVEIDAQYATTCSLDELKRDLADETQTDDRKNFA